MTRGGRYPVMDWLRIAFAAIVVLGHLGQIFKAQMPWALSPLLWFPAVGGFLGLSGFLVLGSLERRGAKVFWRNRFLRVMPAFLASFVVVGLTMGWTMPMVNSLLAYVSMGTRGAGNLPLWSLMFEELTYLTMFALFLAGGYKRAWVVWTLAVLSLALYFALPRGFSPGTERWMLLPFAFFSGNLCYIYREHAPKLKWVATGLLGAFPLVLWIAPTLHPLLFAGAALSAPVIGVSFDAPTIKKDYSYGLYIYHYPVLMWAYNHALPWWLGVGASVVLAVASYDLLEAPILRLKDWKPNRVLTGQMAPQPTRP